MNKDCNGCFGAAGDDCQRCQETQNILHQIGQQEFEKTHTREEFMKIFGRSYL